MITNLNRPTIILTQDLEHTDLFFFYQNNAILKHPNSRGEMLYIKPTRKSIKIKSFNK